MDIVGIDYSMSCPSVCFVENGKLNFVYATGDKRLEIEYENDVVKISGVLYSKKDFDGSETKRYIILSSLLASRIPDTDNGIAIFEGYSFGSKGRLSNIGENTGIMKAVMFCKGYRIAVVPPSSVKKFAGSGKFDKVQMAEAWFERFGYHVHDITGTKIGTSPSSDVIDSFFVREFYVLQELTDVLD